MPLGIWDIGIHGVGAVGAFIGFISYLIIHPRKILLAHAASWGFWVVYFSVLDAGSGVAVALVSLGVCLVGASSGETFMHRVSGLALLAMTALAFYTRSDPVISIAFLGPLMAAGTETLSVKLRDRPVTFRLAHVFANFCWGIFGVVTGAWVSFVFALLSGSLALGTAARISAEKKKFDVA